MPVDHKTEFDFRNPPLYFCEQLVRKMNHSQVICITYALGGNPNCYEANVQLFQMLHQQKYI